jgi:hypothetical protein
MATCVFDFIVGPILYNVLQFYNPGQHLDMWHAITLQGGGLYHIAMGAILGISAYGNTKEKISGADAPLPPQQPRPGPQPVAISAPAPAPVAAPMPVAAPAPVRKSFAPSAPAPQIDEPL